MRASIGRGETSGDARKVTSGRPGAHRPGARTSTAPSHVADVLSLQRLAGNAATARVIAVQRRAGGGRHGRGRDDADLAYGDLPGSSAGSSRERQRPGDDDADLAYGSYYEAPEPVGTPFHGMVGGVSFVSETNGAAMRKIYDFVSAAAPHFRRELAAVGSVTVRFGRTKGGTPGEWRAGSRSITLDNKRGDTAHLRGTAVFEILNAAAAPRVAALENEVRSGRLDVQAQRSGWQPAAFFAMEVERIEWENGLRHRAVVAAAGGAGTGADLFSAEGDFNTFYGRQVRAGHTHSYEWRYSYLREEAASEERRRRAAEGTAPSRTDQGHGHPAQESYRR